MKKILLKNVNIYDGTKEMELQENASILINGNKIEKIGKDISDDNAKVFDLNGKYVIPGLINLHVHIPGSGKSIAGSDSTKKLAKLLTEHKCLNFVGIALGAKYVKEELYSGVTTLRAVGGLGNFDGRLRDQINKGKKDGPRIIAANYAIAPKEGHMAGTVAKIVNDEKEAIAMVDELVLNQKSDFIKIMITGGVLDAKVKGEPGILKMPPEIVKACCDEAHKLNVKVAAHIESYEGALVALENGVDTIEHGVIFDEKLFKLFDERNASFVATLSPAFPICFDEVHFDEFARYNSFVVLRNIIEGANKLIERGYDIGFGTDTGCPYTTHYNFYKELVYASRFLNASNKQILYFATLGNAKIVNKENEIGSIEVGKFADLVIVNNDPLSDFNNVDNPYMVIKDGKIYQKKIKKYDEVEKYLASVDSIDVKPYFDKLEK